MISDREILISQCWSTLVPRNARSPLSTAPASNCSRTASAEHDWGHPSAGLATITDDVTIAIANSMLRHGQDASRRMTLRQRSMSMWKTRLSRCIQLMGGGGAARGSRGRLDEQGWGRCGDGQCLKFEATTPWYRVRWARGHGTRAGEASDEVDRIEHDMSRRVMEGVFESMDDLPAVVDRGAFVRNRRSDDEGHGAGVGASAHTQSGAADEVRWRSPGRRGPGLCVAAHPRRWSPVSKDL